MPAEFIYTTYKLARHYPPDRTVLENISLSFYPGAKIGVIGPNGAGKSSLLRIMAGLDDGFTGEARLTPGFTVGYLEPGAASSTRPRTSRATCSTASPRSRTSSTQYNAVMAKWSEPDADYEAIGAEQAALEDRINAADAWNLERNVDIAMDALRCPPDDADVTHALRRREAPRRARAGCCSSHPDLLLLDEPTNHLDAESVEWLERFLQEYAGTVVAITHDRYFLDNVAQWILELDRGRGIPFEGNYSSWLEQKLERMAPRAEDRPTRASGRSRASSSGCACRRGPARRRARPASAPTSSCWPRRTTTRRSERELEIAIPPGPRLGDRSSRSRTCARATATSCSSRT